jgi:hypothetical protein
MTDLGTVGVMVASAFVAAAEAGLGEATKSAAKDAYEALKKKLMQRAGREVATLEAAPDSSRTQGALANIVDAQPEEEQKALHALAEALIAKLKENSSAIGLDIGRLNALEAQLGNITVTSGVGARIGEANVGSFNAGHISVGDRTGK